MWYSARALIGKRPNSMNQLQYFGLVGVGGYIAPRHLKAIKDTGNSLVAAMDPKDSVGVLDQYFPEAKFFVEIERFDRFLEKLRRQDSEHQIDYLSVCSPNYLHDAHVRLGLRVKAHVICEKPLVLSPWNIQALEDLQHEYQRRVYTVLQLRLLPKLVALREAIQASPSTHRHDVRLAYVTRRGPWYHVSWKGDHDKSGGIAMNIGIHFFDLLLWVFGACEKAELHLNTPTKMAGTLELERARVQWFLSIDEKDLPKGYLAQGKPAYRSLSIDGQETEFSESFTDMHTEVYKDILKGGGFGLDDVKPSIELVHQLREKELTAPAQDFRPILSR